MAMSDTADRGWLLKAVTCGVVAVGVLYLFGVLIASILTPLRGVGRSVNCQANLMRQVRAFRMYALDYQDLLPPAEGWMDRTAAYLDRADRQHCPGAGVGTGESGRQYGYAMWQEMGGRSRSDVDEPGKAPLLHDSTAATRSACGTLDTLPRPGRHVTRGREGRPARKGNFVGYLDGSVKLLPDGEPLTPPTLQRPEPGDPGVAAGSGTQEPGDRRGR